MGKMQSDLENEASDAADDGATCWICLGGGDNEESPLVRGCACRGTSGYFHVSCLVEAAWVNEEEQNSEDSSYGGWWHDCPTCTQSYTPELRIQLGEARWDKAKELPYMSIRYRQALIHKAHALSDASKDEECEMSLREVFNYLVRRIDDSAGDTVTMDMNLVDEYIRVCNDITLPLGRLGRWEEARKVLVKPIQILEELRQSDIPMPSYLDGYADHLKQNLADLYIQQGSPLPAVSILEEVLENRKAARRKEHTEYVFAAKSLARALALIPSVRPKALAILQEIHPLAARILGPDHHETLGIATLLQNLTILATTFQRTATVVGLESRVDLNGSKVDVVHYVPLKGSYYVLLWDNGESALIKPSKLILGEGFEVEIQGLVSASHLNGQKGTVKGFDEAKGRYIVELESRKMVLVKLENAVEG